MSEPVANPFPVVGVGASAGGLEPLRQLLDGLSSEPGLAVVVIQHLDPHHESQLSSILQTHTPLRVVDAEHGQKVRPDHVYVIQPNTQVAIVDGVLSVTARPESRQPHYPVDHFLRSLATVQGPYAVGVVLSGTGSDGTLGIGEIKAAGGVTFAQDEASAQYSDMPRNAVASGAVDLVLPPHDIGVRLATLPQDPYLAAGADDRLPAPIEDSDEYPRVLAALQKTSGVDFSQYRDTTIKRRTARRMLLRGFTTPAEYAQFVERDRAEAEALFRDVLINVTSFFRDPEMFEELKREVFPQIAKNGADGTPIRVWAPGCSTGQEAYSVAIALLEYMGSIHSRRAIQIFATDLGDAASLERARAGAYPESIEAEVSPERLSRFFVKEDRTYRVAKFVREQCTFARQNVTVDPPFSHVDLITCRNVLIYMSSLLQERLLPIFHFALNRGGYLVLGVAETVNSSSDLFELINRSHKIYRRKEHVQRPPLNFMTDRWLAGISPARPRLAGRVPGDFQREAERVLLSRYAPPSVLVNERFEIQHFRGRTSPFLEAPAGQPTTNILRMAREGLFMELRSAIPEAKATRAPIVREGLRVMDQGSELSYTLRVLPVNPPGTDELSFLVLFETKSLPWTPEVTGETPTSHTARDVDWMRRELASSKHYVQTVVDQHEMAEQELRAAHEEVLSSNEELKSTNEELETTKEELQSANEELTTVNEQYRKRNTELGVLTDELANFIGSADLPMVTVGRDMCIRRLTPAATRAFNLLPSDVGRSIDHIRFPVLVDDIRPAIDTVMTTLKPWQQEAKDRDGRWWLLRAQPYRTGDNRIDGATIVAVDIDAMKSNEALAEERDYARAIVQTVREPLAVLDAECRVGLANEAFYTLFRTTPEQVQGRPLWDSAPGSWVDRNLRGRLLAAGRGTESITHLEIEVTLGDQGRRALVLNATPIVHSDRPPALLLAVEDVTNARAAESLRIDAETLRQVDRRKDEFLGILAHELRNPLAPMRFALEVMRRSGDTSAKTDRQLQVLDRQVNHLVRIIDDLLDVSRITQGKLELRKEVVSLSSIVHGAIELCRPAVDAVRHQLKVSLPAEAVMLRADPVRLTQMLVNILNNAVKFTPPGGHIYVVAETSGEAPERPDQVRIRIRDTGIGIAPELRPKIFDLFAQGDRSLERTRAGLGVGLTLVRNLAHLHGGSVDVRSDGIDSGTEVILDLPIERPERAAAGDDSETALPVASSPSLRILVADDNEDGREMMRYFLEHEGHAVATAGDGVSALAAVEEFRPEVAILDIGMPGLNGYKVAEQVRRHWNQPVTLIALSGLGQEEDKRRAIEAGFDVHFTKPVDISTLSKLLASVAAGRGVDPEG